MGVEVLLRGELPYFRKRERIDVNMSRNRDASKVERTDNRRKRDSIGKDFMNQSHTELNVT